MSTGPKQDWTKHHWCLLEGFLEWNKRWKQMCTTIDFHLKAAGHQLHVAHTGTIEENTIRPCLWLACWTIYFSIGKPRFTAFVPTIPSKNCHLEKEAQKKIQSELVGGFNCQPIWFPYALATSPAWYRSNPWDFPTPRSGKSSILEPRISREENNSDIKTRLGSIRKSIGDAFFYQQLKQ